MILKWLLALAMALYVGGLAVLFFKQRSMLFPIPTLTRTSPQAVGNLQPLRRATIRASAWAEKIRAVSRMWPRQSGSVWRDRNGKAVYRGVEG
jgi:hypothetical protein